MAREKQKDANTMITNAGTEHQKSLIKRKATPKGFVVIRTIGKFNRKGGDDGALPRLEVQCRFYVTDTPLKRRNYGRLWNDEINRRPVIHITGCGPTDDHINLVESLNVDIDRDGVS
ncbi:hypothetical protein ACTXT7_005663 [Hymenolepis weldensis]